MIGRILKANKVLIPEYPKPGDFKEEKEILLSLGYRFNGNKREDFNVSFTRLEGISRTLFTLMSDDAYLGRLY